MTLVKICGITRLEDAQLAVELGASALGFVFWPSSPRYIPPSRAADIIAALPPRLASVGVFVDQTRNFVWNAAEQAGLTALQLHGSESPSFAAALPRPVIKAVAVGEDFSLEAVMEIPRTITVLLDAHDPIRRGGTGVTIDWSVAASVAWRRPIFLSGGLNPGNIQEAIAQVNPHAVDISSGVESAPGIKDPVKLRALFDAIGASEKDGVSNG
ncbi:MAG: phosphoribosylanthranilate isomerase, partial [Acidobacteriota bacterium]|nr:phosphoribosylanthranilate isomerase [Acidobacteriota bacterium]